MKTFFTRTARTAAFALAAMGASLAAQAQTTITLNVPGTHITDVTIQAGASANTNFNSSDTLATRASASYDLMQRALLKIDTQNTMPAKSVIQSAMLTLTVKSAGADASRAITVYPVTTSFLEAEATWNRNRAGPTGPQPAATSDPPARRKTCPTSPARR